MSHGVSSKLLQNSVELKLLDNEIVKQIINLNMDKVSELLTKFVDLKKEIKLQLIEYPVATIQNSVAKDVLEKVTQELPFQADKILDTLQAGPDQDYDFFELGDDDIQDQQDLLYSWFGPNEYVCGLYRIGTLIIGLSIPNSLYEYVAEARQCYAFMQYNAVYGLCRTIIETAIRHKCQRKGIIRYKDSKIQEFDEYRPGELINKCTRGGLRDRIKDIYYKTSTLLHGRKTITSSDALFMFKDTLKAVQDLEKA